MSLSERIYAKLPIWAQHLAVSAYGYYWKNLRFGGISKRAIYEYTQRSHYNKDEWKEWQDDRLAEILNICCEHVPYYRDNWTPEQKDAARNLNLDQLPLLEKAPLRHNAKDFCRTDIQPKTYTFHTSGSTGTPIESIYTLEDLQKSMAVREVRSANWADVSFEQPRATFSGRMVEPNPNKLGPLYRYNLAEKQVYFSPFHLSSKTAYLYVHALNKHHIVWMTGYAVSSYLLAKFMLENNLKTPHLKAIITTSEKLTDSMRQVMEKAYGCKVYEEYSTVETAAFASECSLGSLHVSPDIGIIEILDKEGKPCQTEEVGEIVVTRLINDYQHLIRFRLGDMGAWSNKTCECGRQMPVLKEISGRIEDVVVGPDGRQMVRFHGVFVGQPHVEEGQVIQESIDHIHVKVSPINGYNHEDEKDIINRVQERLGSDVRVTVETVSQIPREKSGKFKAVISNLKEPNHLA